MANEWIIVRNWSRFQHYGKRRPIWIKVYTEVVDKYEWQQLSLSDRGLLTTLWVSYAVRDGVLTVAAMKRLCPSYANRYANIEKGLKRLQDAGFIEIIASEPLALRYQDASLEVEVEIEKDLKPLHVKSKTRKPRKPTAGPERITYQEWQATLKGDG